MDVSSIKEVFDRIVLWGCAGAFMALALGCAGVWLSRMPLRVRKAAKRFGWPTVVVLGAMMVFATIEGTPTNEDKQRWQQQQQQEEDDENNALGMMYFGGVAPDGLASSGLSSDGLTSTGDETTSDDENESASQQLSDIGQDAVVTPSVRSLTSDDYASGVALVRIGTNEVWDFSAPAGAEICTDWLEFGAERDWFKTNFTNDWSFAFGTNTVDALTVYSWGMARPTATNAATFFAPMQTRLGIVPVANWEQLAATDRPSQFWQYLTPSNTFVMTWQNVLLDRASDRPVSFQAEFEENGDVMFRYDLSRLADDLVTNLVVGISNDGVGCVFNALSRGTTSLKWVHLDPTRAGETDPDGDGLSTDEEVLVYHTDPYRADTDMDGLSDGQEVDEHGTDPLDPHSIDPRYPDGVAVVLGDVDPFSYPEGSTNTVWEHVFYTGTTNAPFAYPQSTDGTAVLRVTVSGSGSGELIVGDQVVPLLGSSSASSPARAAARSGSAPSQNAHELMLRVGRGVVRHAILRGSTDLALDYSSDDFCIGVRPTGLVPVGWFAFPNTKATEPCIHDLNAKQVSVSLDPGPDIEGLTCAWSSDSGQIRVENRPPLSAVLTGSFQRNATQPVSYKLQHPHKLFGIEDYVQTARFCPRRVPGNPADPESEPEEGGHSSTEDSDPTEPYQPECWCRSDCEWCDCPCHWNPDVPHTSVDPDNCPLHDMPYEQCEPAHSNAYHSATNGTQQLDDVLKLHVPRRAQDQQSIQINVPDGWVHCCDCRDHWTNYVSVAYKSHRIAAHLNGEPFDRTVHDGALDVYGVQPSSGFGDATLSLCKTGHVYETHNYTVLGVGIRHSEFDLDRLNGINRNFGLPTTVQTNLESALRLKLRTDVLLPSGDVHLALEEATARMQLWMLERDGNYHLLLDTEGKSSLDMPLVRWKKLVAYATSDRETEVRLLTFGEGRAKLFYGYAGENGSAYVHDEAEQMISVIRPPILPDYNHDGEANTYDAVSYGSQRVLYFWANNDTWTGDDAFEPYSHGVHLWPMTLPSNGNDSVVNGRNDLVNLCPLTIDLSKLSNAWANQGVSFEFVSGAPRDVRFIPIRTKWNALKDIVNKDQWTISNTLLHSASFSSNLTTRAGVEIGYEIPTEFHSLSRNGAGALAVEFIQPGHRDLTLRAKDSNGLTLVEFTIGAEILDVHDMFRWLNLDGECNEDPGRKYATRRGVLWPDSEHADANVIFVHGYNVHPSEAWDWGQAMFKRLWWQGLNAGFTAVLWRGNDTQVWIPFKNTYATKNYHQNVLNAFRTAGGLSRETATLPGARKYFIAHSLGNMLVSESRQFHSLQYEKYFMLNAAVAVEAYDAANGVTEESKHDMTPAVWRDYADCVKATHWYELFNGDPSDLRGKLTWKGRFKDVDNTINFYSSQDEVVANGDDSVEDIISRNYAWYNQEMQKGFHLVDLVPEAGWEFGMHYLVSYQSGYDSTGHPIYSYRHYNAAEAAGINPDSLKTRPLFSNFTKSGIYGDNGSSFLQANQIFHWRVMSHGIPAESFAAGANPVPKWNTQHQQDADRPDVDEEMEEEINVDMATRFKEHRGKWIHSYFIGAPLCDTFKLFERIVKEVKNGE